MLLKTKKKKKRKKSRSKRFVLSKIVLVKYKPIFWQNRNKTLALSLRIATLSLSSPTLPSSAVSYSRSFSVFQAFNRFMHFDSRSSLRSQVPFYVLHCIGFLKSTISNRVSFCYLHFSPSHNKSVFVFLVRAKRWFSRTFIGRCRWIAS